MSPTFQKWEGRWDQLVGRVKTVFGGLIANEHLQILGQEQAAIGARKEKVAQAREEFEERLEERAGS